ncbi:hypothetical protein GCM10010503_45810 [Streptomyces lucensis JCM 4490]|uniref:Secreted protein n=1 Tax=Streptomyces lucensis JCM 4490 TaxID=1306176 RepID=A0A918MU28_9ACTN|nr:DUF3515 family protein [Streptomyces lucensis]GGW63553.1 hypothetical protein GCM10010503_45810 [Streptomyces lucensis JCM 4490]
MTINRPLLLTLAVGSVTAVALQYLQAVPAGQWLPEPPHAASRPCARLAARFPDRIGGLRRDPAATPGTAVWGGGALTARCGLDAAVATPDPCSTIGEVDWVWRQHTGDATHQTLVTYGRDPALEVRIDKTRAAPDTALISLTSLAERLPANGHKCVSLSDTPPA